MMIAGHARSMGLILVTNNPKFLSYPVSAGRQGGRSAKNRDFFDLEVIILSTM
jgi:hypothetical protein